MKLLPSIAFIGAAAALDCSNLDPHTLVEMGGEPTSVTLSCTYDSDDMNNDVQVEIAAEDTQYNHQKILKQAGADGTLLAYDINFASLQTMYDRLNVTIDHYDGGVSVTMEVVNAIEEIDGIELQVSVEAGTSIDQSETSLGVYQYPSISADLLTVEFDEDFSTQFNETMPVVQCNYTGGYIPQFMGTVEAVKGAYLGEIQLAHDVIDDSFGLSVDAHIPHGESVNGAAAVCDYVLLIGSDALETQTMKTNETVNYFYSPTYAELSVDHAEEHNINGQSSYWVPKSNSVVDLICRANGNPLPDLTIEVNDQPYSSAGELHDGTARVNVGGVGIDEKTTATCSTENGKTDSVVIDIHYIETPIVADSTNVNRTTAGGKMSKFIFSENDSATLKCTAKSNPMARTVFKRNGVAKSFGTTYTIGDTGNYTCNAANDLNDESNVAFELIVHPVDDKETSTGGAGTAIIVIIVLLVIVLLGAVGFYCWKKKQGGDEDDEASEPPIEEAAYTPAKQSDTAEP